MKKRNLSAKKIIHNFYKEKLKNPRIKKIYLLFKKELSELLNENYCVAISGGSDSMALAFLTKCLSLETKKKYIFCHIDHRLRESSNKDREVRVTIVTDLNSILENINNLSGNNFYKNPLAYKI